jgi:hypothetical protein
VVAIHENGLGRVADDELVRLGVDGGLRRLDGMADERIDGNALALELELATIDPADVEQVVDQAPQMIDLPAHHGADRGGGGRIGLHVQKRQAVEQRRHRIAQLVREHGEKAALVRIGQLQLGGALPHLASSRL